jgi:hypothetical protein
VGWSVNVNRMLGIKRYTVSEHGQTLALLATESTGEMMWVSSVQKR